MENEPLVEKLEQVEKLLDEYENKIYIGKVTSVEPDLSLDRQVMMSMHYSDLQAIAWDYSKYILFLQKEVNKHQSRYNWAEANLKRYLERESVNYEGWKWEERQANALTYSEYANLLHKLKVKSKLAIDRLSFLPSKIQVMLDTLKDIIYTKRRFDYAENRD